MVLLATQVLTSLPLPPLFHNTTETQEGKWSGVVHNVQHHDGASFHSTTHLSPSSLTLLPHHNRTTLFHKSGPAASADEAEAAQASIFLQPTIFGHCRFHPLSLFPPPALGESVWLLCFLAPSFQSVFFAGGKRLSCEGKVRLDSFQRDTRARGWVVVGRF
jgi:hypothetical protein